MQLARTFAVRHAFLIRPDINLPRLIAPHHRQHEPHVAALDAAQSGWLFSAERGGTLWVKVPAGEHGVVVGR